MLLNSFLIISTLAVAFAQSAHSVTRQMFFLEERYQKIALIFCAAVALIFRTKGWDVEQYYQIYYQPSDSIDEFSRVEYGFAALMYSFRFLGFDFFQFNAFFALASCFLLCRALNLNANNFALAFFFLLLFYFFRGPYGQVRQAFSIFCFFATVDLLDSNRRGKAWFFLINGLAASIHSSSLLVFLYPALRPVFRKRATYAFVFILFKISLFFEETDFFAMSLLQAFDSSALDKVRMYSELFPSQGSAFNPDTTRIVICSFLIFFQITFIKNSLTTLDNKLFGIFFIGVLIYSLTDFDYRIASRASSIFLISDIFIYANFVMKFRNVINRLFTFFVFSVLGLIYLALEFYMMSKAEILYSWRLG